jgi:hypothetical protein
MTLHQTLYTLDIRAQMPYNMGVINETTPMPAETEEFLTRCVVDTLARKFYLYSSEGSEKVVECESVDQFMNVLEVVRTQLNEDTLVYSNPF